MADKLSAAKDKIIKSKSMLYSDIYYNDDTTDKQIQELKNRVNNAIEKISANNMTNTGESNISLLYQKTINPDKKNGYDILNQVKQTLSDRNTMNNILAIYTQNTLVRDIDREIDMVCKYMPKLDDALDTRREHVMSADHFSKDSIVIKSAKGSSNQDESILTNIKTLKEKYNIEDFLENEVYKPTDKYGEAFIYIIPYKKAIETLLKKQYNGMGSNLDTIATGGEHESASAIIESAIDDYSESYTSTIETKSIVQEAVNHINDLYRNTTKIKEAEYITNSINEACNNVQIEFNNSRVIKSALMDRFKTYKAFEENGSLFFNEKAETTISNTIDSNASRYAKSANDTNSMAANGVTLLNDKNNPQPNKVGKIEIPGCVVKALDHEMVKPLYIDDICLGYFYIECDKKMSLEQTTYSSTIGGIRPGGAYKGNYDHYKNAGSELEAIKSIADAISKKIDAKFVNANQDLSKEIYSILKYNSTVDPTGKISKITITFIPPEDMVHCYFDFDKETHRGISGLARSLFPAKLFSCLYISNVIQSVTRGFDKRVYYVRQAVDTNIAGVLMNVINQIQRSNFGIRQIESMSNVLNMIGRFNDIVIPRSASGDAPVDFEVIPGQQTEVKTDLMNMLEELAVNATGVPFEMVQTRMQTDYATHLTMVNARFLQAVLVRQSKTQKIFSAILTKIYNYEYNMDNNNEDEIEVKLPPPIYLNATNGSQIVDAVIQLSQSVGRAYVNENNDQDLLMEFSRQIAMKMISSLFPEDFIDKAMNDAKLLLTQQKGNGEVQ